MSNAESERPMQDLEKLAEGLGSFPDPPPGQMSTYQVLSRMAKSLGTGKATAHRGDLEALCRKIHVANRVDAAYGDGWKKLPERTDIDPSAWLLIIGLLLRVSSPAAWSGPEAEGLAMKCLNAALAAEELARAAGAQAPEGFEAEIAVALSRIAGSDST